MRICYATTALLTLLGGCACIGQVGNPVLVPLPDDALRVGTPSEMGPPTGNTPGGPPSGPNDPVAPGDPSGGKGNRGLGNGNENQDPSLNGKGNFDKDNPGHNK